MKVDKNTMGDWLITDNAICQKNNIFYIAYQDNGIRAYCSNLEPAEDNYLDLIFQIERSEVSGYLEKLLEELGDTTWILLAHKGLVRRDYFHSLRIKSCGYKFNLLISFHNIEYTCQLFNSVGLKKINNYLANLKEIMSKHPDSNQWLFSDLAIIPKSDIDSIDGQISPTPSEGLLFDIYCYPISDRQKMVLYRDKTPKEVKDLLQKIGQELAQTPRLIKSAGKRAN